MLQTKEEIKDCLDRFNISFYRINDDLTVDVDGYVNIMNKNLVTIPLQFGVVKGDFFCGHNKLISLKGSPYEVTGTFHCENNHLTDLNDCPKIVGYDFKCVSNPLISLGEFNTRIKRDFIHHSATHKIVELEQYYYESINPKGKIFTVWMPGIEISAILLSLKLEDELSSNMAKKNNKLKV